MVQAPDMCVGHADLPHALVLVNEMTAKAQHVAVMVDNMIERVRNGEISSAQGLSFLEMKYNMLLSYLINLTFVVLRKCSGEAIEHDPCIDRLIEIRTVLEKIRPIDNKLKYQIDKLVKSAVVGPEANDPITFKANPQNFLDTNSGGEDNDDGDDDGDDEEEDEANSEENEEDRNEKISKRKETGKYVPPKLVAMHYEENETAAEREKRAQERARKHKISAAIMQDLRDEYLDLPAEVRQTSSAQQKINKEQQAKEAYEEEYLTRLPITKKEKHNNKRRLTTMTGLGDEIVNFNDPLPSSSGTNSGKSKVKRTSFKSKGRKQHKRRRHF